ncbi:hypothetical protein BDY24DRAFT_438449 [Mrakia frigida]|uniref:uncharacterized protein n=1 Tax=Mrakia frigida TaxID=29902 RepID=UPI003FCC151C
MSLLLSSHNPFSHSSNPSSSEPTSPPPPLSTLISTQAGVLFGLSQTQAQQGAHSPQYDAHDLLWGYVDNKVRRRKEQPLVVAGKMGELEREMVRKNLCEFAREAQEVRRQHSLPPSRAFPLSSPPNPNPRSRSTSTSRPRRLLPAFASPHHLDAPLEILVLTQHGVLRGLASSRASEDSQEGHAYARELLKGYVENKVRRGIPPLAVSGKLGMLEREMLRAEMTQFAADVQHTRLILCMPPSRIFRSSSSSNPRSSSTSRTRLTRPPVFRAPSTIDGVSGAPPAYEARDPNPSEEEEREAVMRGRMRLIQAGREETEGEGEREAVGLPSFEEVVGGRVDA